MRAWVINCHDHPLRRNRGSGRLLAGGDEVARWCYLGGQDLGNDRFTRINHVVGQYRKVHICGGTACREADPVGDVIGVVAARLGGAQQPVIHRERGSSGASSKEAENHRAAIGLVAVGDSGYGDSRDHGSVDSNYYMLVSWLPFFNEGRAGERQSAQHGSEDLSLITGHFGS